MKIYNLDKIKYEYYIGNIMQLNFLIQLEIINNTQFYYTNHKM